MFSLDSSNVFRAPSLAQLGWLEHGFGTRVSENWPPAVRLSTLRQIHSDQIIVADRPGELGEGDALISNQPGITLGIRTADCLPILMADVRNRAVAAVHAGWRGAVSEVAAKTVAAMARQFGSRPEDLVIAIGPGIDACCFEVGPEVARQFAAFFPEREDLSGRARVDLVATIRRQLSRNGDPLGQIASSGLCTVCRADLFHSFRRDREVAGRMVTTIGVR